MRLFDFFMGLAMPHMDGRTFGEVFIEWQQKAVRGIFESPHALLLLEKGAGKTLILAGVTLTEILFSDRFLPVHNFAADREQAGRLHESMEQICLANPQIERLVKITQNEIRLKEIPYSYARTESSEQWSIHGITPGRIHFDELGQVQDRNFFDAAFSSAAKRQDCRVRIISTPALSRDSILHEMKELIHQDPDWYFRHLGPCSPWKNRKMVELQRKKLSRHKFLVWHEAQWADPEGRCFSAEEVQAVFQALPEGIGCEL